MEDRSFKPSLEWKVVALGSSNALAGPIPIDAMRYSRVKKALMDKCYRRDRIEGDTRRFMHPSIKGLYVYINDTDKSVKAQADGASALSQAAYDLELPSYRSGG